MFVFDRKQTRASQPPAEFIDMIVRSGDMNREVSAQAMREVCMALETPLRKGNLYGDVTGNIFEPVILGPNAAPEFPLDPVVPGLEREFKAYTIPGTGRIPERCLEADYVTLFTYAVGSSVDWPLRLARAARFDIVRRAIEIFMAGFVKKDNDDAWATLLAAAAARNIVIYDGKAGAGRFSMRLLTLMDQAMRRNAGGNVTSLTRGRMTDLYGSIEIFQDMRNLNLGDVPESFRNAIFMSTDGFVAKVWDINFHPMIEFGVGQEYQAVFTDPSGINGTLAAGDVELLVGLDLQRNDSFVHPIREQLQVFSDDVVMHRQQRAGLYGWKEGGWGVLDNRRVLLGSA